MAVADGDARSIADLLVDQVEFADVLLLNKTDLVSEGAAGAVETALRRLNPTARLLRTVRGEVDLGESWAPGCSIPSRPNTRPAGTRRSPEGTRRKPRSTASAV